MRQPAYRLTPPAVDRSAGVAAVALMRELDMPLDDWQEEIVLAGMGRDRAGQWVADSVVQVVSRQNGKTPPLFARLLWGLVLGGERKALWSAHEFKTASETFIDLRDLCEHERLAGARPKFYVANGKEAIRLTGLPGSPRVLFIARSKSSARGFGADLVISDEAFALTDYQMAAIIPAMSARDAPQAWYASSAPLEDSAVLRRIAIKARNGESQRTVYREWCADAGDDPTDPAVWAKANPGYPHRITDRAILSEIEILSPEDFARERLTVWSEAAGRSVFKAGVWSRLGDPSAIPPPGSRWALAADVSPDRAHASIAAAAELGDGRVVWEVLRAEAGGAWIAHAMALLMKEHKPHAVIVEDAGQGKALAMELEELGMRFLKASSGDVQAACARAFDAIIDGTIVHLEQSSLTAAVEGARQRDVGDSGWVWSRRRSSVDVTPLTACTLAFLALRNAPVPAEVWVI